MLRKKVPLYAVAAAWAAGTTCVMLVMGHGPAPASPVAAMAQAPAPRVECDYTMRRVQATGHVRPFLSVEPACESPRYAEAKARVAQAIAEAKAAGDADAVGVYMRDFQGGEWFSIDGQRPFDPGSLLKVPVALTMLKMAEADPALAQRSFKLKRMPELPVQHFPPSRSIDPDSAYSFGTLLEQSLERSDNLAHNVLVQHMDFNQFRDLLRQVGLPDMKGDEDRYPLSPMQVAQFFKVIYNTTLLGPRTSEYALQRLLHSEFNRGLRAGVPAGTEVASKFGEAGREGAYQLHEAGLVFTPQGAYLAVVMTEGRAMDRLPGVLARVSAVIHQAMTANGAQHPA
jgi:beta-lactamase class A